eukprot:3824379-Prymnesium_polylepis.1
MQGIVHSLFLIFHGLLLSYRHNVPGDYLAISDVHTQLTRTYATNQESLKLMDISSPENILDWLEGPL